MSHDERALGMDRQITRREFLDGMLVTAGAFAAAGTGTVLAETGPAPYPPALTGLRGQAQASFSLLHALRDGAFWEKARAPDATGEIYDLVVVGGGISGLTAYLYRQQAGAEARVLILENCDDFGGHARRNEFTAHNGTRIIGYGGSQSLQTPSYFSPAVKQLLRDIAVDTEKFTKYYDQDWAARHKLGPAAFFCREQFGVDRLVRIERKAAGWVPRTPLNPKARRDLIELIDAPRDYLSGRSRLEKFDILARISYAGFLTETCGYDPQLVTYFQEATEGYLGIGADGVSALDAWGDWEPGFDGMDLGDEPHRTMSASARRYLTDPDPYIFHFPDGNAGIARALVRAMIPAALKGRGMESLVVTPVDYGKLDLTGNKVRLRLAAPVVKVAHDGTPGGAGSVTVTYVAKGRLRTVQAGHVVLACWHRVIPYLTNELAPAQIEALNDQQKVPLVVANVLVRDWRSLARLGIRGFKSPAAYWHGATMDFPVSMGGYHFTRTPDDPALLSLFKVPLGERGEAPNTQSFAGRRLLMQMSFAEMEHHIRDLLGRALAGGGFDPARDIEAITINRWAHGYAREYKRPWDNFWPDGPLPITAARQSWGRIAIANADSGAYPYANCAIDQAARAVRDLLGHSPGLPAFADFPGPPRDMIGLK
ncbi:FAD/NAD(P)-binding protein [Nordella sp. HKS 07]|uniref:NAD(P)-binding protein n=1 Tax=Nordella sp. HKS 07 TaxID=2712222 RepID=UPI001FEEDBC4|nr:FAD/NAD(P)-binding protein [Nordella sp. HKS 07]